MDTVQPVRIHGWTAIIGLFAALPAIQFVSLNILKYELGVLADINIYVFHPVILIGGSIFAVLINAWSVVKFRVVQEGDMRIFMVGLANRRINIAVLGVAAGFILIMFAYLVVENFSGLHAA